MLRLSMLFVIGAFAVGSLAHGQEAKEEENIRYEKLKALEPIIGTWSAGWTNDEKREQSEIQTTYSWSTTKKMILCVTKIRTAKTGEDLAKQDWVEGGPRYFYIWNTKSGCIEQYSLYPGIGEAAVSKVEPKGGSKFEITVIHAATDVIRGDAVVTVTQDELLTKIFNRQGDDGEKWDDIEMVSKRVN